MLQNQSANRSYLWRVLFLVSWEVAYVDCSCTVLYCSWICSLTWYWEVTTGRIWCGRCAINVRPVSQVICEGFVQTYREMAALIQVMAWCLMAPSHYLSQCWSRSRMHWRYDKIALSSWFVVQVPEWWLMFHDWTCEINWQMQKRQNSSVFGNWVSSVLRDGHLGCVHFIGDQKYLQWDVCLETTPLNPAWFYKL